MQVFCLHLVFLEICSYPLCQMLLSLVIPILSSFFLFSTGNKMKNQNENEWDCSDCFLEMLHSVISHLPEFSW